MPYVTLSEAAEIVERETGIDITVLQLLRAGAVQNLPLCVLLDTQCYSPTHRVRREKLALDSDPDYWKKPQPVADDNLDVVNAYGLFMLPPRHVFAYQMSESVRVETVTSLDGQDIYFPGVTRTRDELQITLPHLTKFIAGIGAAKQDAEPQAVTVQTAPVVEVPASEPHPVTTVDVAHAFAGIKWSENKWLKPLGDKPKWLAACIAIPGVRGVSETRWNPVLIGAALVKNGHAKPNSIRARFQTKPQLAEWLDAWKTYEADNLDTI